MTGKRVLICCMGDGRRVPRALRFSRLLSEAGYEVWIASNAPKGDRRFHITPPTQPLGPARRLNRYGYFTAYLPDFLGVRDAVSRWRYNLRDLSRLLERHRFELILVQDLAMLPVALKGRHEAKVIFDAREYYPAQNSDSAIFDRFERPERVRLCAKWMPRADAVITVSQGIAEEYARHFAVEPQVITSASKHVDIRPSAMEDGRIRLVHHGVANRNRKLDNLIKLMALLRDDFTLDLFLASDSERVANFTQLAAMDPRIRIRAPVPFDAIVPTLNRWDIGIHYLEPDNLNLLHCMPNKLFEFIQARLAVAIGPSPDMAAVVQEHGCGVVSREFSLESIAESLNGLTRDEIAKMKHNSDRAARLLCAEVEGEKLLRLIERLAD